MFPKNKFFKDDSQKFVTQSVFELQKCLGTQNASPENFQRNLVNKFYHTRPPTLSFGNRDENNRYQQHGWCGGVRHDPA